MFEKSIEVVEDEAEIRKNRSLDIHILVLQ